MRQKQLRIKESEYSVLLQVACMMVAVVMICLGLNRLGIAESLELIINAVVIGIFSVMLVIQLGRLKLTRLQWGMLLAGYFIRILVMFIDIYAADYVTILHSGDDALGFYNTAVQLYETGRAARTSHYAKIISALFGVFGENRVLAQYINILCFLGTALLVIDTCRIFDVPGRCRTFILAFISFLPNYICLSSILLRESFMIFADTLAVYCFIRWMRESRTVLLVSAFLAALPAIILHSASIGLWISFFVVGTFWNGKEKRLGITKWTGILLIGAAALLVIVESVPMIRNMLLVYFPSEFTLESITGRYFREGGSDYLMDVKLDSWAEFPGWTIIRMIYFTFSPMPLDWRGLQDMAAFVIDSVPILVVLFEIIRSMFGNKNIRYIFAGLLVCLSVVGIFAWGVSNAGTAMRHRGLLVGVFALCYCMSKGKEGKRK